MLQWRVAKTKIANSPVKPKSVNAFTSSNYLQGMPIATNVIFEISVVGVVPS